MNPHKCFNFKSPSSGRHHYDGIYNITNVNFTCTMLKICNSSYKYKNVDVMDSIRLTYLKAKFDEPENNIKIKNI